MPPPFPKDRQDHLLPGRSCLFFAKALTGKAARNGRARAAPPGNKPECAASSHRSRLSPKRRPPSPSRAGTAAKRLLLAAHPLSSALTMNRGRAAPAPPRGPRGGPGAPGPPTPRQPVPRSLHPPAQRPLPHIFHNHHPIVILPSG